MRYEYVPKPQTAEPLTFKSFSQFFFFLSISIGAAKYQHGNFGE